MQDTDSQSLVLFMLPVSPLFLTGASKVFSSLNLIFSLCSLKSLKCEQLSIFHSVIYSVNLEHPPALWMGCTIIERTESLRSARPLSISCIADCCYAFSTNTQKWYLCSQISSWLVGIYVSVILLARNVHLSLLSHEQHSDSSCSSQFFFVTDWAVFPPHQAAGHDFLWATNHISQGTVKPFPIYASLRAATLPLSILPAPVPPTL